MSWWDEQIQRVAVYLYRDQFAWSEPVPWRDLPAEAQAGYVKRATSVGHMFNFPNASKIVDALDRLCPCDHDPETTQGPERECPLHGDLPWAVIRISQILHTVQRYVDAPPEPPRDADGSPGDLGDQAPEALYARLVKLLKDGPYEPEPDTPEETG